MAGISGAITSRRVAISRQATRALLRDGLPACDLREYEPPRIEQRDVVASSRAASDFGWLLEERARRLKLHTGARQAFVADGAKTNWRIWRTHFPQATPIADLLHALSYAWSAAAIEVGAATYQKWAQLIWQGDVAEVIEHLATLQHVHGPAPADVTSNPRHHVDRALTYFRNNAAHMHYPDCRRQGLPLTSAHVESTVKQINRRVKGTEKFWERHCSEAILQLCADYLSDSPPDPVLASLPYHPSQLQRLQAPSKNNANLVTHSRMAATPFVA